MFLEPNYHAIGMYEAHVAQRFNAAHRDFLHGLESGHGPELLQVIVDGMRRHLRTVPKLATDERKAIVRELQREVERVKEGSGVHDMKTIETGGGHGVQGDPGTGFCESPRETASTCLGTYSDRELAGDNPSRSALEARGEWGLGGEAPEVDERRYDLEPVDDDDWEWDWSDWLWCIGEWSARNNIDSWTRLRDLNHQYTRVRDEDGGWCFVRRGR